MNQSLIRLAESGQPAVLSENALREALRIADLITKESRFPSSPGYMNGHAGTTVFLTAALPYLEDRISLDACRSFLDRSLREMQKAAACLRHAETADLSLSSGLTGMIHALLQLYYMTGRSDYAGLLSDTAGLLVGRLPGSSIGPDLYLGISGCILVLARMLRDVAKLPFLTADKKNDMAECLSACMKQLLSMRGGSADSALSGRNAGQPLPDHLWDTIRTGRAISGLGHGMAGIACALLQGVSALSEIPACSAGADDALMADCLLAARDALLFEIRTYNGSIREWPDLRPKGGAGQTLHGICSGAPGIGLGLLASRGKCGTEENGETADLLSSLAHSTAKEADRLLALAHDACLYANLRETDHLCCGRASLAEYLLTCAHKTGSEEAVSYAGRLLAAMNADRQDRGSAFYRLPQGVSEADVSLFFGLSGIGFAFLRYAAYGSCRSGDSMPALLPF